VTTITLSRGLDVIIVFARGLNAIMATRTSTRDVNVIEIGWHPAIGRVTTVALCRCLNMII